MCNKKTSRNLATKMALLAGKYQLVENKNFYEFLIGVGVPEDKAKSGNEAKGTLEVTVDANNITLANNTPAYVSNLVVGQEVDEKMVGDAILKSTASLSGNVLTVSSTKDGNSAGSRTYNFSSSGLEVTLTAPKDGTTLSASRSYKRV